MESKAYASELRAFLDYPARILPRSMVWILQGSMVANGLRADRAFQVGDSPLIINHLRCHLT